MHYLTSILLSVFVFKLSIEAFVCILDEGISHLILVFGREDFGAGESPWLISIELGRILVRTQVHTEGELVLCELSSLNQVMEVIRVANVIDVDISWSMHGLATLPSLNDLLKL